MSDLQKYENGTLVFGDWRITEELGSGSYGTVYKIEKTEYGITADAALKVIRIPQNQSQVRDILGDGMDEKSVTSYFQGMVDSLVREIAVMSTLKSHPNIVTYENHKVIAHPGTVGWDILIQMELLTPLRDHQNRCPMTEPEVRRLAADLCSALVFCQKKALIHRDIKPQNIFVSKAGQFKLGDFGVARTMDKSTASMSKQGTEDYMAPEVYRGEKYGPNVDIYSLGLVLYRLMNNNRLPFMPPAPKPIGFGDRLNALTDRISGEKEMTPPCNASPEFARIILKACAHDPKDRYQTAAEMLEALNGFERTEPVLSWPEPPVIGEPGPQKEPKLEQEPEDPGTLGPFSSRKPQKQEPEPEEEDGTIGPFSKRREKVQPEEKPKTEPAPKKAGKFPALPVVLGAAAVCAVLLFALTRSGGTKNTSTPSSTTAASRQETVQATESIQTEEPSEEEGTVETYTYDEGQVRYSYYDSEGHLNEEELYSADGRLLAEMSYTIDAAGNDIREYGISYEYTEDGVLSDNYTEYFYDAEGALKTQVNYQYTYDGTGDAVFIVEEYTLNADGVTILKITRWYDGDYDVYHYDENGLQTSKYEYTADDQLKEYAEYTRNSNGDLIRVDYFDGDGSWKYWREYLYDEAGKRTNWVDHYEQD